MKQLRIEFYEGPVREMRVSRADIESLPDSVGKFNEAMMQWYHERDRLRDVTADDLLRLFPTFIIRVRQFLLEVGLGGEKYPESFSLSVYNPNGAIVDDRNFLYPTPEKPLVERWPHGTPVVDGTKQLVRLNLEILKPVFAFIAGGFTVVVHHIFQGGATESFSIRVLNKDRMPVYAASYLWGHNYEIKAGELPDGSRMIDSRKAMEFIPVNPDHPPFVPPE